MQDKIIINRLINRHEEPLAEENLDGVLDLVNQIRLLYGNTKTIWLYTGFVWSDLWCSGAALQADYALDYSEQIYINHQKRQQIVKQCDVLVDGRYVDSLRNPSLAFRGSENQSIIDIQKSIQKGEVVLWKI